MGLRKRLKIFYDQETTRRITPYGKEEGRFSSYSNRGYNSLHDHIFLKIATEGSNYLAKAY